MVASCTCPPLGLTPEQRNRLFPSGRDPAELEEQSRRFAALNEDELERWREIGEGIPDGLWLDAHPVRECPVHPKVFGGFYGWVALPDAGALIVTGRLAYNTSGEPVIRDLAVEPDYLSEPDDALGSGIVGGSLRALQLASIREQALARLAVEPELIEFSEEVGWGTAASEEVAAARRAADAASKGKQGRRYPDEHYERVARLYLRLVAAGKRKGVHAEIARRYNVKPERIRDWVHRATKLGYLEPGRQGAAGARPGPRLSNRTEEE